VGELRSAVDALAAVELNDTALGDFVVELSRQWCEAHHVVHWIDHGPTDLDNLVLVCWRCHRNIHDHHWQPIRAPDGRWTLRSPPPRR
jgi:hypothetical protein